MKEKMSTKMNKRVVLVDVLKLEVDEVPVPTAPAKGAIIKTHYAGICHSDVHIWHDRAKRTDTQTASFKANVKGMEYPLVLGHEFAGEIFEMGEEECEGSAPMKVGDHVAVYPWMGCSSCKYCLAGDGNFCKTNRLNNHGIVKDGGYQTYVAVYDRRLLQPIPQSIPMEVACTLPCSALTAYRGICLNLPKIERAAKFNEDGYARMLIVGSGGLGLWGVQWAKLLMPANTKVFVADVDESKMEIAKAAGADGMVIWPVKGDDEDIAKKAIETMEGPADGSVDFFGSSSTAARVHAATNKGGMQIIAGLAGGQFTLTVVGTIRNMITVSGIYVGSIDQLKEVIQHVATGKVKPPPITKFKLGQVEEVFKMLEQGKLTGRGVVDFLH